MMDELPESLIAAFGVAACEIFYDGKSRSSAEEEIKKLSVRLRGNGAKKHLPFRELKAFQIGKFLTVYGNVVRVSPVKPLPVQISFKCAKCLQSIVLPLKDGIYRTPTRCKTHQCTSKIFHPERDSVETKCINIQKIKLQELLQRKDDSDEGRIPRILEVDLTNDLVDSVMPGESIIVSGILKTIESAASSDKKASFGANTAGNIGGSLYLEAVSVERTRNESLISSPTEFVPFMSDIRRVAHSKKVLESLVKSFCPYIYGNELIKVGVLLCLFGGSRRSGFGREATGALSIRSDPHVLIVGDPGLGKSQMLNYACTVSPRSVFVCANTSTAIGLTATVQDGALEAGALVLADQGVCCIDEFDKIVGDGWRSLLDVMEQQTVNVAKAGVVCALPARTSILAAANPVSGHYNKERSVVENLKMDSALLSRFDLIFVLLDRPNAEMDKVLSEHVLSNMQTDEDKGKRSLNPVSVNLSQSQGILSSEDEQSLKTRLNPACNDAEILSDGALRAYIAYARNKYQPRITEEAAEVLQEFYLELRKNRRMDETLPITTRNLESMIRLSEARAKMELRNFVTKRDALDIIELMRSCTADIQHQEPSGLFRNKSRPGSKTAAFKKYAIELMKISSRTGEVDYSKQQLNALYETLGIGELGFEELIACLNENGYLLKRGSVYRLIVT